MNLLKNKKIGIWGFGVVGKAALSYFSQHGYNTTVMDSKSLTPEEASLIKLAKSTFINQKNYTTFFDTHDFILASPGIDLRPYEKFNHKFITELDIFSLFFKKPIISITGTIGKTSITHLLSTLLKTHQSVATGGNIGTAMLTLIDKEKEVDYAVLELSSFQLEFCSSFAPDLAIWTNFFPNHLDRHGSIEHYFKAKCNILAYQKPHQQALIPLNLLPAILKQIGTPKQNIHFFCETQPKRDQQKDFPKSHYFWIESSTIMHQHESLITPLINLFQLPDITFAQNWLIISAALHLLKLPHNILQAMPALSIPSHRVEKIASINDIHFYNDSKATVPEATLAAVKKLQGKPIILFIGGISKGVDRTILLKELKNLVSKIYFFGAEAHFLAQYASNEDIHSAAFSSLEEAFNAAISYAQPGDQILFSPSGASYDLFAHYEERGNCFKQLVNAYVISKKIM